MSESTPILVRRATPADEPLARQAVVELHDRADDPPALRAFLNDPSCYLILAIEAGRVVGSLSGYALRRLDRPHPQFLLYGIDVRPECRRRGIGRLLVDAFTTEARSAGAYQQWVITNFSNSAALALYRAAGYTHSSADDVVLNMPLQP